MGMHKAYWRWLGPHTDDGLNLLICRLLKRCTKALFEMADRRIGSDAFETAAEEIKRLGKMPDNQELLDTYMYYKQVIIGECNTSRPGILDQKGRAKWDAWNGIKGMSKEEADKLYVEYVEKLKAKYGLSDKYLSLA